MKINEGRSTLMKVNRCQRTSRKVNGCHQMIVDANTCPRMSMDGNEGQRVQMNEEIRFEQFVKRPGVENNRLPLLNYLLKERLVLSCNLFFKKRTIPR